MERRGKKVDKIILLDTPVLERKITEEENQEYKSSLLKGMSEENVCYENILTSVVNTSMNYYNNLFNLFNTSIVTGDIHLIRSVDEKYVDANKWNNLTDGKCYEYQVFGEHNFMLEKGNEGLNEKIIRKILK